MRKLLILAIGLLIMPSMKFTTSGQSIDDAKVVARTIIGNSLRPPRPKNQTINKVENNRIITWDQALASSLFLPETYIVTIKDASTGVVKRIHTVQLKDAIPAIWTYHDGAGDQSKVTIANDGSVSIVPSTAGPVFYQSQPFTPDATIEWEVDSRIFAGMYVIDASGGTVRGSVVNGHATVGDIQFIVADSASGLARRLLPASKISILVTNEQPEFLVNGQFWMRGYAGPVANSFQLRAWLQADIGDPLNEAQAFLRVNVRPGQPRQFYYSAAMLQTDFPSSIPLTVKVEIVQVSARGISSAIATVTG